MPDILDSFGKGYSVCEIIWQTGQQWLPSQIKHCDPRWFRFDRQTDELGLRIDAAATAPLQPGKFITHIFTRKSGRPIRGGLARAAAWYYLFKNLDIKGWAQFADRYGQPFRVGRYGAGATDADKKALLRAVRNIAQDAGAIIPQSMEIQFVEAATKGTTDLFEKFAEWIDRQISKLVLGQTGTTDVGQHVGTAEAHEKVRGDIANFDARMLAATINRDLVRPLVDINFGQQQHYPRVSFDEPSSEDVSALVKNVDTLVRLGLRISEQEMREHIGLREPQGDERILTVGVGMRPVQPLTDAQAADALLAGCPVHGGGQTIAAASVVDPALQPDALDDLAALALSDWEPQADELIDPVRELVDDCESLEELLRRLPELVGKLDLQALTEALARAMFNARLAGEVGAQLTDDNRG
jgi:phage gp29-like protein